MAIKLQCLKSSPELVRLVECRDLLGERPGQIRVLTTKNEAEIDGTKLDAYKVSLPKSFTLIGFSCDAAGEVALEFDDGVDMIFSCTSFNRIPERATTLTVIGHIGV